MGIRFSGGIVPSGRFNVGNEPVLYTDYPAPVTLTAWPAEATLLNTSDTVAGTDQYGSAVALSSFGTTLLVGALSANLGTADTGGAFVYTNTGGGWVKEATLAGADRVAQDFEGYAVALSYDGDTALVGAYRADAGATDAGAAYVFHRSGGVWSQQAKLVEYDPVATDLFGGSVTLSADGNTAVVGANLKDTGNAGAAYVFTRSGSTWTLATKLTASDKADNDYFGVSVALSGDGTVLAIGAVAESTGGYNQGSVYVFTRSGSTWTQAAKVVAADTTNASGFGNAVALPFDGGTLVVGCNGKDTAGTDAGAAYIFTGTGSAWSQVAKLMPADIQAGDRYGTAVSIAADGSAILVGSPLNNSAGGSDTGAAYMYTNAGGTWVQKAKLYAPGTRTPSDQFGNAVALSGNGVVAVVGASLADTVVNEVERNDTGMVYVFRGH